MIMKEIKNEEMKTRVEIEKMVEKLNFDAGGRCIEEIILHCSATPEGRNVGVEEIRRWHVKGNGWRDVGYHFVVRLDGSVEAGRPLREAGAHCRGHNARSVGVCYVGGLAGAGGEGGACDTRTPEQRVALRLLVGRLRREFEGATVHGHCEFAAKACPCFDVKGEEW